MRAGTETHPLVSCRTFRALTMMTRKDCAQQALSLHTIPKDQPTKKSSYWMNLSKGIWCCSTGMSQSVFLAPYPSIVSSSKGAGLSQTGQVHVGFFSFICRKKTASKHCRWAQVKTRQGTPSRIFTNCKIREAGCN